MPADPRFAVLFKPLPADILFALADVGEAPVAELAIACDRSHQSIANGLAQLEAIGLVRASTPATDRIGRRTFWTLHPPAIRSLLHDLSAQLS